MKRLGLALWLAAAGCIPEEGPMMRPGSDCLECHGGAGGEESGRRWTVAGTWAGQGNQVVLVDAGGKTVALHTNRAGNFWTAEPLAFPLQASVNGTAMPQPVTQGSCNRCHGSGGAGD